MALDDMTVGPTPLWEVRQLPRDVDGQMGTGILPRETIIELPEESGQLWLQLADLLDVHRRLSPSRREEERVADRRRSGQEQLSAVGLSGPPGSNGTIRIFMHPASGRSGSEGTATQNPDFPSLRGSRT